jgi:hypothetical protein
MHRGAAGFLLSLVTLPPADVAAPVGFAGPLPDADARVVETVRRAAMRRLQSPECRKVLADFADAEGRPLAERLAVFDLPADEYLGTVAFRDGRGRGRCRGGETEMVTTPGAARILVCPAFLRTAWRDRTQSEVYVIHEMLHTLGLGENPPSSRSITAQVERRCAP